jgi:hypothetical protein
MHHTPPAYLNRVILARMEFRDQYARARPDAGDMEFTKWIRRRSMFASVTQ